MSRLKYVVYRSVQTVVILWAILTFLFFFFRLMPGSYVDMMVGAGAGPETRAAFIERWGLDEPLYIQYLGYLTSFLQLDVGRSMQYGVPVWELVNKRIFNTFILVAPGVTVAYIMGTLIGARLGTHRGDLSEKFGMIPVVLTGSIPEFFTAILLVILFASPTGIELLPPTGMITPETAHELSDQAWWNTYVTGDFASHYILPFMAVVLRYLYFPTLIMRTNVVETLGQDFIYYHRITGIPDYKRFINIIKHSILPVITLYPVSMTRALGGLVLIEVVFNWPGIGFTLVESVLARDFAVVQFIFIIVAAFVIISNFIVDIIYGLIDPRISIDE